MVAAMGLSFLGSLITTRRLGASSYGDLQFVQAVWALLDVVSTLGYLQSGSRMLLLERDTFRLRQIVGIVLLLAVVMGVGMMAITASLAHPIDHFFRSNVAVVLIVTAPLMVTLPLRDALTLILQCTNKVVYLAILNTAPYLICLVGLVATTRLTSLSVTRILYIQQASILLVSLFVVQRLKPQITSVKYWLDSIANMNKTYGWQIYVGALVGVASGHLNRLAISYWVDNTAVGFYSLATSLAAPLYMVPDAVATSSFRNFAQQTKITRKVLVATAGVSGAFLIVYLVLLGKPLSWVYPHDFASVGLMAQVAAFGAILLGLGNLYNRFLGAHGEGRIMRNTAFAVGAVNIIGLLLLVPIWKAWGAIAVYVLAGATYLGFLWVNYRKFIRAVARQNATIPEIASRSDNLPSTNTKTDQASLS
jgi:O-antigen/teichoic acid export membrane protein